MDEAAAVLRSEAASVGACLSPAAAATLLRLVDCVLSAPFRATAARDAATVRQKHVVDSLACLGPARLVPGERVIDVGSGAGFPGLPVAVACPGVRVDLVDSVGKKVAFLQSAIAELGVPNAHPHLARAEDLAWRPGWREAGDCVLARGVAPLAVLAEFALPLCRDGGRLVALKGPGAAEELRSAERALRLLGGTCVECTELRLPGGGERRTVLRIERRGPMRPGLPRAPGTARRRPL